MGNNRSSLKETIEVGEEIPKDAAVYRLWSDVKSCVEGKKHKCTIFSRRFAETDSDETRSFYENGLKILRQLRHPHIVSYVASAVSADEVLLLTERVQMLDLTIDSLSPIEIHTGLTHTLDALTFLHDKAQICHNNISPLSIFITSDGQWKLGGFECAQKMTSAKHWVQTDFVRSVKIAEFAPPEDKMMLSVDIPPTARDAYAFGKLIYYAMNYLKDNLLAETVDSLIKAAKRLTDDDASKRGELGGLLATYPEAFSNHLTAAIDFLQNLHSKCPLEKQEFFSRIVNQLKPMPEEVIGHRLVPLLLSRHVLLDSIAHEILLPTVLQPAVNDEDMIGLFCEESFRKWVIPEVIKIFCVHETTTRLAILSHFHLYMRYFTQPQLDFVLVELSLGMQDNDDRVVSASLHAMADLVTVIGGPAVTGLVHSKVFADGTPKKSGVYAYEEHRVAPASKSSSSAEREVSISPSCNLLHLLNDDELPEQPQIRLLLERIDSADDTGATAEISSVPPRDDWGQSWGEVEENKPAGGSPHSMSDHQNQEPSQSINLGISNSIERIKANSPLGAAYGVPEIFKNALRENEPDFFADMEPVVSKAPSLNFRLEEKPLSVISKQKPSPNSSNISKRFIAVDALDDLADIGSWDLDKAVIADCDTD